ncbi:hypothetical protein [Oligoflexus tunisiensis]|uniref:hypothetical protein n=1 Tax=Oligoflexus tunisiensis TaxID=708132 RepID=UPI00114C9F8A|nr:hypothetical protein [Oligoflexus tunisiensis]
MDHVEVNLYLYRSWAEALARIVRRVSPTHAESLAQDPDEHTCLKGAFLEISEALQEVGI